MVRSESDFKIELDMGPLVSKLQAIFQNTLLKFGISHLLLLSFALHFFAMGFPQDGGMVFDEAHYVPAALKTLQLIPANAEHTPLAKIVIALSMAVFGNYWFAWRFPIVVMAIATLYVFYLIAKKFLSERYSLFATAFLSFDIMFFIHGAIFILDMPAILFGLLGMLLYLNKRYKWSAVSFGVSILMKENGAFFLFATLIYHAATHFKLKQVKDKVNLKPALSFFLIGALVVGGGMWIYDAVYKPAAGVTIIQNINYNVVVNASNVPITTIITATNNTVSDMISNPVDHFKFALNYFASLVPNINTTESNLRQPWTWVLPIGDIFNSPRYLTVTVSSGNVSRLVINWVSQVTPFIAYMLIPVLALALWKRKEYFSKLYISWIASAYLPWVFIGAFIQRMTFNYYFIYTIPAICLGIPFFWKNINISDKMRLIGLTLHLLLTILFFLAFFPVIFIRV